jgi:hypothetical protein
VKGSLEDHAVAAPRLLRRGRQPRYTIIGDSTDADRVQLGHLTGRTWEIALEQLDEANKGIVIASDTPPASAPLQAVALNQLAAGPSRWMPAEAPGQARSTSAPDR